MNATHETNSVGFNVQCLSHLGTSLTQVTRARRAVKQREGGGDA